MAESESSKQRPPGPVGENDEVDDIQETLAKMTMMDAAEGKELYRFLGSRVIEYTDSNGRVLAVKVGGIANRSESDMMHYAATHGVETPRVHGFYDIITTRRKPIAKAMVTDRIPGVPLDEVWGTLTAARRAALIEQLRDQLARMRLHTCAQPFIGRVGQTPTRNTYDKLGISYYGPFDSEEAFDDWCLAHVSGGALTRFKWRRFLASE